MVMACALAVLATAGFNIAQQLSYQLLLSTFNIVFVILLKVQHNKFLTTSPVETTSHDKCHCSHVDSLGQRMMLYG